MEYDFSDMLNPFKRDRNVSILHGGMQQELNGPLMILNNQLQSQIKDTKQEILLAIASLNAGQARNEQDQPDQPEQPTSVTNNVAQLSLKLPSYTNMEDLYKRWENPYSGMPALNTWGSSGIHLNGLDDRAKNSARTGYLKRQTICQFIESFDGDGDVKCQKAKEALNAAVGGKFLFNNIYEAIVTLKRGGTLE